MTDAEPSRIATENAEHRRRMWRDVLGCVIVLAALAAGLIAYGFYRGLHQLALEDRIMFDGGRIIKAIEQYAEQHGHPPDRLADLTPDSPTAGPAIEHVERIVYTRAPVGGAWTLRMYTDDADSRIEYVHPSTGELDPADHRRSLGLMHDWFALKPTDAR